MGGTASFNSKDKGDETEATVIQRLISNGYSVSIPFGDNDKYDLIVDDGNRLYRVQCKTAWANKEETMRFNTHSQTTKDGEYHEKTYHGEIDAFLVRYPEDGTIYWVDVEDATEQKMELRFDAEIAHPSINWAEEYKFDGTIP
ncbi:group I intron-associated PD-(D/E)XK endonuclease [Halorussus salilacus]|uniref:group I intron-associated PD-(D/E)XK endonuclease n=1 Tax=Halorussus salilacus TaxID=2953750 RepID=UPI00209EC06E|nr:group I intron-associated PD-(D/E)XK endonuclease [Halorussus salilacus]USZ69374.1 group I intron-associated PD-(D/E)XK endonuclease [Halorussus salilacus]